MRCGTCIYWTELLWPRGPDVGRCHKIDVGRTIPPTGAMVDRGHLETGTDFGCRLHVRALEEGETD